MEQLDVTFFGDPRSLFDPSRLAGDIARRAAIPLLLAVVALVYVASRSTANRKLRPVMDLTWYQPILIWALFELRDLYTQFRHVGRVGGFAIGEWYAREQFIAMSGVMLVLPVCFAASVLARRHSGARSKVLGIPIPVLAPIGSVALLWSFLVVFVFVVERSRAGQP